MKCSYEKRLREFLVDGKHYCLIVPKDKAMEVHWNTTYFHIRLYPGQELLAENWTLFLPRKGDSLWTRLKKWRSPVWVESSLQIITILLVFLNFLFILLEE